MKIRRPWIIKAAGLGGAWLIRLWMSTLRYRHVCLDPDVNPWKPGLRCRYLYAFWHEGMLLPAHCHGRRDIWVLISQHADGELIAQVCRHLGFSLVRGSTTRGGVEAARQILRLGRQGHLAITPDGPRGPRRQVQPGLVHLAARTGMPVVPAGIAYEHPWRMRSWDRFALPRPWTLAACVLGAPIRVPADVSKAQLEEYRRRIEDGMHHATAVAEQCVTTGKTSSAPFRKRGGEQPAKSA